MPRADPFVQQELDLDMGVNDAVFQIDEQGEHGEVFTRRWVVDMILDLSGFTIDRDLGGMVGRRTVVRIGCFPCSDDRATDRVVRTVWSPADDIDDALRRVSTSWRPTSNSHTRP